MRRHWKRDATPIVLYLTLIALPWLAFLSGCTTQISASPINDVTGGTAAAGVLAKDFQSAAWNLDQAVSVGALAADDPAPACLHAILTDLGMEGPPPPSFTPRNDGLVSAGSILYIRAQQLKKIQGGGITVPVSCEAVIGRFTMDAVKAGVKIGASFIPIPKPF
jgi:hypothetical protein